MITLRRASDRGHGQHGWLDTRHSFSFANYYDPEHMNWGPLRVINDDRVKPGYGFDTHGHRDMEIISYVLSGTLAHKDSMGNQSRIVPGEVQRMSAGTGVLHSEYNHEQNELTHFLQIWIIPDQVGLTPSYEQKSFPEEEKRGRLRLVASPDGRDGSVTIHQNALVYSGLFDGDEQTEYTIPEGRLAYVFLAQGEAEVNGHKLAAGDGLLYEKEPTFQVRNGKQAELLLFDLPNIG